MEELGLKLRVCFMITKFKILITKLYCLEVLPLLFLNGQKISLLLYSQSHPTQSLIYSVTID